MINDFDFCRPASVAEALEVLSGEGKVVPLAGGTNLLVNMKRAPLDADLVVDLSGVEGLGDIEENEESVRMGAAVTFAGLQEWRPGGVIEGLMQPMAAAFAGPLIRNLATVGGNLCDASPAADLSPPLLAMEAKVGLESASDGSRVLSLKDFFLGVRNTARRPQELLTFIDFPRPPPDARWYYYKLGKRKADAISIVSIAMTLRLESGVMEDVRIALGAVAPVAMRSLKAEEILRGQQPSDAAFSAAAAAAAAESRPIDDFRSGAAYRRRMVETLVARGLREMTERK